MANRWQDGLFLCVGLDSDYEQLPTHLHSAFPNVQDSLFEFNRQIIVATARWVSAFKPNLAFYEQSGLPGLMALKRTCDFLKKNYPDIPIILDAKRGDIGNTNRGYATSFFDYYGADAVTVQPYLGREALVPFLSHSDKHIFVLCRTSNPGGAEIQKLLVEGEPLYLKIARLVQDDWNRLDNVGLVAGATYPEEIAAIRAVAPDLPLLIPGVGSQGGDLVSALKNGLDRHGGGVIINSSRSIIYASEGEDFAEAAGKEAEKVATEIRRIIG
ncbi:MAG: orotidine-5'-phosphate decarboxylase [Chloroflexota bacterium]|nr:orotidine-5'-phosphate decarboxylase [Chloroflexota bacterium]